MPRRFKRKSKSKAKPTSAIDKKQERDIKYLKHMVKRPEMKQIFTYKNLPIELTANTNAMVQYLLTDTVVGSSGSGASGSGIRIGDEIDVHRIKLDIIYNYPDPLYGNANFLRFILMRIKGLYRTVTPNQVLQLYQVAATQRFDNMISHYNADYTRDPSVPDSKDNDQHILWDKIIPLDPVELTTSGMTTTKFRRIIVNKTFKRPLSVTYNANTQAMGHVVLLVLPGQSTSSANNAGWTFNCSTYFTDS